MQLEGVKKKTEGRNNRLRRVRSNKQPPADAAKSSSTGASLSATVDSKAEEDPEWSRELEIGWSEVSSSSKDPSSGRKTSSTL